MLTENLASKRANVPSDLCALLADLAERDRLAFACADKLAAAAKRVERDRAVLFPHPDGREIPVVANLSAGRDWVADATGVSAAQSLPRFLAAARDPNSGVQNVCIHRCQITGKNRIGVQLLRNTRSAPSTASRRIGRTGVERLQRRLAETAPVSGRNCPVNRRIIEAKASMVGDSSGVSDNGTMQGPRWSPCDASRRKADRRGIPRSPTDRSSS
jgi:hypothetical protein